MERVDPPDITVILWEPVLHHQIGTSEIMRAQFGRLVELSRQPTVTIHVLPSSLGPIPDLAGRSTWRLPTTPRSCFSVTG